jgi:hypothetical protein
MGQIESSLSADRLFNLGGTDFALVLLAFALARDAFFFAIRFAAMRAFFSLICGADQTSSDCDTKNATSLPSPRLQRQRWNATSGRVGFGMRRCRQILSSAFGEGMASPSEKPIHLVRLTFSCH